MNKIINYIKSFFKGKLDNSDKLQLSINKRIVKKALKVAKSDKTEDIFWISSLTSKIRQTMPQFANIAIMDIQFAKGCKIENPDDRCRYNRLIDELILRNWNKGYRSIMKSIILESDSFV